MLLLLNFLFYLPVKFGGVLLRAMFLLNYRIILKIIYYFYYIELQLLGLIQFRIDYHSQTLRKSRIAKLYSIIIILKQVYLILGRSESNIISDNFIKYAKSSSIISSMANIHQIVCLYHLLVLTVSQYFNNEKFEIFVNNIINNLKELMDYHDIIAHNREKFKLILHVFFNTQIFPLAGMFHISNMTTGVLNSWQFFELVLSMLSMCVNVILLDTIICGIALMCCFYDKLNRSLARIAYDINVETEYSGKSKNALTTKYCNLSDELDVLSMQYSLFSDLYKLLLRISSIPLILYILSASWLNILQVINHQFYYYIFSYIYKIFIITDI